MRLNIQLVLTSSTNAVRRNFLSRLKMSFFNGKQRLNNFLSSKLRENISTTFVRQGTAAIACIGSGRWVGTASFSTRIAENNAAWSAFAELSGLNEEEIRQRIGFPARPKVAELDEIRDVLKRLKFKMRRDVTPGHHGRAFRKLGGFYKELEEFERVLVRSNLQ